MTRPLEAVFESFARPKVTKIGRTNDSQADDVYPHSPLDKVVAFDNLAPAREEGELSK